MYVLNGKVVLYPDGTGVDKQESDDVLYVQDVQTGELFTIAPNRISELAEPTDPQAVIAEREEAIAAATNQEIEQEEGAASGTAAPTEAPEVRIPAPRFSGARVTLDLPNGSSVNGVVLQETDDGVEVQTDSPVNGRFVQVFPTDEFDGMLSSVRDEADEVIWSREVAEPVDVEEENQNDAAANGQQREMQGNGIPVDAKTGEPVYEAVAPDVAWDAIVQEAEGDEAMAMQVVTDMVADMEAKVQKAKKAKVRAGSSVRERLEAQKKHKRRIEEAEAQLEAWRRIAAVKAERIAAAERAKIEAAQQREVTQDDETEVPDFVFDKPENARERGYRMQNGQRADRQEPIAAAVGKEVSVKFTNKVSQPVRVAVVDARSLQPSHQNGQPNVLHFLPEAQPKKRTDHESVHAAEQMAAQMNPEEITSSVTAYTGAPSVNARGEVIQGNNRTAALKRMWQGYPEQAAAYKQYLMDHASEYGLNPEDIAAMEQPVLVNLMDVTDEQAIELGQYDVKDTESGGTERIKPRNVSQKMGDKAERFASILLRTTDEDASVSQLIDEHAVETLKWLEAQHYISPTQYRSAFNAEGEVTTEAKNDLRGILYQAVFKNGSERLEDMFNALPAKAQRAILATAYRDFATPESEKMLPEIQNSIVAFYELSQDAAFANAKNFEEARKATMAWLQQMQFDFSTGQSVSREGKYTNFALTLAAMYKVQTQTAIQQTFNEMFDLLQGRQQPDLLFNPNPNNTPRTLAEAIREVLNIEYDGTNGSHALGGNNETRTTGRQGSARDDSAGGTDAPGNAAADAEGGTGRDKGRVGTENEGRGNKEKENDETEVIGSSMTADEALDFIADMELSAEIAPEIDLTIENWDALFGKEGIVSTPIGNVKMGENQFTKLMRQGRNGKLGMIKPTLEHPHAIIADVSEAKEGDTTERASSYVFIRSFKKVDGSRYYYFTSITVSKDGKEVVISNQEKRRNAIANLLTKGKLVWKHADDVSDASDMAQGLYSSQGNVSDLATEGTDAPQTTISSTGKDTPQNSAVQTFGQENAETSLQSEVTRAEQQTNAEPTEGQKEAGNYKKGRVKVGPFDVVIEQPRGSVRSGVDANGKAWETTMQNTYGYFGGTKGVDGDAIDVFLGNDLDGWDGITVFVVDQYNPDGSFDEHKVMLGFNSQEEAEGAYFANYEADWAKTHRTEVTAVPLADFTEWVNSSKRKTKAFAEYKVAKRNAEIDAHNAQNEQLAEQLFSMAKEAETEKDFFDRAASLFEVTGYESDLRDIYNGVKSGEIANARALSFYTNATLKPVKAGVKVKAPKSEQKAEAPRQSGYERKHWHADSSLEEMLAREKYLQNAMSFGTKEMAEVFPMAEEWQRDREELKAKYGDDLKNALPNDVKNAFLKKHRNTFANQTALNDELYELRSAIISHKEKAASRAEAAAKEQKAEEANKRFGDFLNGKTPLRRASIVKALTRVSNFGKEGSMTMAQFIEKHVAEGTLELRTKEVDKLQGPSRRQLNRMDASQQAQAENRVKQAGKKTEYLINGFVANKTAYEYAEHLLATKNGKAGEKPRKHAAQPGAPAVSTQEATLRDALVDVAQQSGLEVVVDEKAQQVLDEVNGRARTMTFGEEYDYDRYPEGRVEPNIADKYVHIERAKLDHGFANFNEAKEWAKSHIVRTLDNEESGGKGNVKISSTAVNKYLSESAVAKSDSKDVHLAVLKKLPEIIHDSVDVETTPDFKKDENGVRKVGNEINKNVLIHRCYGAVEINGNIYRVKITLKEYKDAVRDNKAYSYEATKIELLAGTLVGRDISSNPGTNNSISVAKLLKDVEMSYRPGVKVLEESAKQRARLREHRVFHGSGAEFDEHQNEDLKAVNERFNEQLGILTEKNADSMVFSLGRPSVVLQSAGVMNKPMKLYGNKVMKKMRKHGFALEELRDLPRAVADPIAVFNNYGEDGNRSILTELRTQQGNFLVTLSTGVDQDVDFNIVRSVFGKGDENVLDWINKGLATYINKEKALSFLSYQSAPIAATAANAGQSSKGLSSASQPVQQEIDKLDTATKVVKDFVNPQLSEENKFRQGASATTSSRPTVANLQAHAAKIVERLHLPNVKIVTDALQLEGKQRTAKGFYNKRTGKITIVLPNHASTADVEQTLLHEAVAHYGLRQLFGEHFDDFLDMVYRNAEEGIRRKIAEASAKHGWNVRTATEEYLADLAERTDFEHASPQWWAKIKGFFLDMLRGLGFEAMDGQTLTDNELRYVLWRSYENLTESGKYPTFIAEARDVAKQHALQVGRFAPTETAGSRVAENEALSEEEMSEILFRDGSTYNYTQVLARDRYERRIKSGMYQTKEALQDSMLGLRTAMESILEAEGRKGVYIEDIDGFENAYLGENRLSSVNQAEAEKFAREQFKVSSKKVCGCNIWVRQNVVASYVLVIGKR